MKTPALRVSFLLTAICKEANRWEVPNANSINLAQLSNVIKHKS